MTLNVLAAMGMAARVNWRGNIQFEPGARILTNSAEQQCRSVLSSETMRFLFGAGRTTRSHGYSLKANDRRHEDIWICCPQLALRVSWCGRALGIYSGP